MKQGQADALTLTHEQRIEWLRLVGAFEDLVADDVGKRRVPGRRNQGENADAASRSACRLGHPGGTHGGARYPGT